MSTPPARTRRASALSREEIARVVRGRAANPAWIAGMMRHGYRGAAEIAAALDGLYAFAATVPDRFDAQFDLLFDATLGDPDGRCVPAARQSGGARGDARARFRDALRRDLWRTARNSVVAAAGP